MKPTLAVHAVGHYRPIQHYTGNNHSWPGSRKNPYHIITSSKHKHVKQISSAADWLSNALLILKYQSKPAQSWILCVYFYLILNTTTLYAMQ